MRMNYFADDNHQIVDDDEDDHNKVTMVSCFDRSNKNKSLFCCFSIWPVWIGLVFFIRIQELNWFKQSPSSSLLPEISMSWLRCLFVCFYHRNNYLLNDEHWFIHLFNDSLNFCLSQCPILWWWWWFKSIFFLSFLFFHYSFATIYSLNCVSCV